MNVARSRDDFHNYYWPRDRIHHRQIGARASKAQREVGAKLNHLAQMAFDYMWLILFCDEDVIGLHYSVKLTEELPPALAGFTDDEKDALAEVGQVVKNRLLAEPDEYGYTPRALVTDEQRRFLDAVISKEIFREEWWLA